MMECNKDEAIKAKDLAEKKMRNRDFLGARRIALKAQRLFPGIENISRMLTICEVHCSAGVQVKGEMNWYGILQVEPTADDSSIKKQYRKLAVLLHPDKNQLTGAEEAFKLIVEAYNILSDQAKRDRYDRKINADIKLTPQQEQSQQAGETVNTKNSCSEAKFNGLKRQKEHPPAFPPTQASWNTCPKCHMKKQNFSNMLYESLPCHHCLDLFVACDLDGKPLSQNANPGNIGNNFGEHQEEVLLNQVKDANQQNQYANSPNMCRRQSVNAEHRVVPTNVVILDDEMDGTNETSKGAESMNAEHIVGPTNVVILDDKMNVTNETSEGTESMNVDHKFGPTNVVILDDETDDTNETSKGAESMNAEHRVGPIVDDKTNVTNETSKGTESINADHRVGPTNVIILDDKMDVPNQTSKGAESMNAEHRAGPTNVVILDAKMEAKNEISKGAEFMENTISEVKQGHNCSKPTNSNAGQKRIRRLILESSESDDVSDEGLTMTTDGTPTKTFTPESTPRRTTRFNKKVAYDEVGSEEGYSTTKLFTLSPTRQRLTRLKKNVVSNEVRDKDDNNDFVDSPCTKRLSDSSVNANRHDKELSREVANREEVVDSSVNMFSKRKKLAWLKDILQDRKKRTKGCKWSRTKKKKPGTTPQCSSNNLAEVRKLCYPDPEFWDFDKSRNASQFAVNQIWATYDNKDGMPRFYARIRQVYGPEFKVRFTWLEHNPGNESEIAWSDKDLPIACGNYSLGTSDVVEDQLMFSHLVTWKKGKKRFSYDIYPKVGEVWALFKDWSIGWSSDAGNHKSYEYEVVEVISEFAKNTGIRIVPLVKIEGFVSLFVRAEGKKGAPVLIPPSEILRFSHHIPSYRLPGTEREGIPANSMELDCASLPANFKVFPFTSLAVRTGDGNVDKLGRHSSSHLNVTVTDKESEESVRVQKKKRKKQKTDFYVDMDDERASPLSPIMFDYRDPEFYNFDKLRSFGNFYRGQIWALYSDIDKYPKYYGWIKKVEVENQRLHVAWLEACPLHEEEIRWIAEEMPISCGTFKFTRQIMVFGRSEFFSHIVHTKHTGRKGQCVILPNCSEVWAIYKNWKFGWRPSDLQNCEYEVVEICKVTDSGIKVLLLTRVVGYRAVFKPERTGNTPATLEIQADEYIRFSHQIPASRITDESGGGGELEGYWELDTAAVPDSLVS